MCFLMVLQGRFKGVLCGLIRGLTCFKDISKDA